MAVFSRIAGTGSALPAKVLVKNSSATITIGKDAVLEGLKGDGGTIGIFGEGKQFLQGKRLHVGCRHVIAAGELPFAEIGLEAEIGQHGHGRIPWAFRASFSRL